MKRSTSPAETIQDEKEPSSRVEQPRKVQDPVRKNNDQKSTGRIHFDDFVNSHHVGLTLTLSGLLGLSGLLLILTSIGLIFPGGQDILSTFIPTFVERMILIIVAALLVVTPFFLNSFIFHALRYERELRIKAQKSTREAQLLQDILTHDIRNYNQVSKMSAELIREELEDGKSSLNVDPLVSSLVNAIEGSTQLVERAKMLGRVISDQDLERRPVNILGSIRNSTELVSSAYPEKKINAVVKLDSSPIAPLVSLDPGSFEIDVLADDLLDEVFANLLSNSAKYTDEPEVFIAIEIRRELDRELKKDCWKVSIADTGKGIPENLKQSLFSRYLEGAKGSGLGMSIVHALVVGRYGGRIQVSDRVERDHTKGTLVEIWLPTS